MNEQIKGTILSDAKTPLRVLVLNVIQFIGILAVALTTPEIASSISIISPEISVKIQAFGWTFIAAKPLANILGDLIDNGRIDKSWHLHKDQEKPPEA